MSSSGESEMNNSSLGLIVALDDVSVEFRMGSLTCVIGAVGSGKSALIQMLAGELPLSAGSLHKRNGSLAYAPQDPWIMDGTIRENILLGREFKSEHYSAVVNACGLDVDIVQLRDGEDSIVGDRGVQLSGGQVSIVVHSFHFDSSLVSFCDLPSFVFPNLFSVQELPWQGHSTKMPTSFSWMIRFRP
jgi:ABC-type Mn2+/Zn2+ transport system ATPase subunit